MKTGFLILILLVVVMFGCRKKEYPVPVNTTEVTFQTTLLVNGLPLEISTGSNGYYMFSSFEQDRSGIYDLAGEFRQTGCSSSCPNSIRFQIYDSKVSSPNDAIDINSILKIRNYDLWTGDTINTVGYLVNFNGLSNRTPSTFLWQFDDGTTSTDQNPVHTFSVAGVHQVSLTATAADMSQSTSINKIYLDYTNDLNTYVTSVAQVSNELVFTAHVTGGTPPYSYIWNFGDGTITTGTSLSASHSYSNTGGYFTSLTVSDSNGKTIVSNYNAVAGTDLSALATNFSFSGIAHSGRLSKALIKYTDVSGKTFTSDNYLQPAASSFEVLSVEDFLKNENNQPVKKVKLKFNCTLYNGAQSVSLQGTEVTVGFAYK